MLVRMLSGSSMTARQNNDFRLFFGRTGAGIEICYEYRVINTFYVLFILCFLKKVVLTIVEIYIKKCFIVYITLSFKP